MSGEADEDENYGKGSGRGSPDESNYADRSEGTGGGQTTDGGQAPNTSAPQSTQASLDEPADDTTDDEYGEWQQYERGDQQFIEAGDKVTFDRDGQKTTGTVKRLGDDLLGVETESGDDVTIESYDIEEYQQQHDELNDLRETLREHFENAGIGTHSSALQEWTDDTKYREFQSHLRSAQQTAKDESPMYDVDPRMETATAILATTDADTAETLSSIQSRTKAALPEEMTVYRGIDADANEFLDRAEDAMENDEPLTDPGFQSTSINRDVADGFGNITLNVQTDHGVYVRAASEHAGEDEILLPAGTEYEVTDVDRESNTVDVVANGGFDLSVDASFIRDAMNEKDLSYGEAVEEVI